MHGRHANAPTLDPGFDTPAHGTAEGIRRAERPVNNGPLVSLLVGVAVVGGLAIVLSGRGGADIATANPPAETNAPAATDNVAAAGLDIAAAAAGAAVADPVEARPSVDLDGCTLSVLQIKLGDTGESVTCLQKALYAAELYDGEFTGAFDEPTDLAVRAAQASRELYVDGIVGAQTATSLGIWPGDEHWVVKTAVPPEGAKDLWGMPLSPVATAGADAPALPDDAGQGTGYRIVYSRAMQRVWAVNDNEEVVRSYLVTGSQYRNELPGVHKVYSRSETTTAWNGEATLPLMVRWLDTERGAIGFHGIPKHRDTGEPYQTWQELGTKLSGGCQRQHLLDAQFMWEFGKIGTPVYVL